MPATKETVSASFSYFTMVLVDTAYNSQAAGMKILIHIAPISKYKSPKEAPRASSKSWAGRQISKATRKMITCDDAAPNFITGETDLNLAPNCRKIIVLGHSGVSRGSTSARREFSFIIHLISFWARKFFCMRLHLARFDEAS